ncbi:GerAB/ArcD/ProY family transporter [Paenibacillus soyae]|uniref:Endospore germination permease n=1 Tax=Paenibacillus soyae TaxID=2969249 RepID=A0A9X2MSS1_9BACL|nr:endospore germination permease [Paenibacillus soyae]MCR2807478.1 endospore germination permease [Paenibacillus soyae]
MTKGTGAANGTITSGQLSKLLFLFSIGSAALLLPTAVVSIAKQDSWISMLLVIPFHYAFIYIYLLLHKRFPKMTLAQYAEKIAGVWLGKAVTLTFVFFFALLGGLVLNNVTDFLSKSVLPQTPDWFIGGTFMISIAYAVFLGVETIARTGEILFAWTLFIIGLISFTLINQMHADNLLPMLYNGWSGPVKGIYPVLGFPLAECVFLTAILPMIKDEERTKLKRMIGWSVLLSGGVGVIISFLIVSVLGVEEAMRSPFSVYEMAKSINIEEILVRVEILVAMVWIGTVFTKLAITVYSLVVMLSQMLKLRTYRSLVFPMCLLIVPLSLIVYRNSIHAGTFALEVWSVYAVLQGVILPLSLLAVARLFDKKSAEDGRFPEKTPKTPVSAGETADKQG